MADEDPELLYIDGKVFDTDDLTYAERREIKRLCRAEIWDKDIDGAFSDMTSDDIMPAVITVFMQRDDPTYTLAQALTLKPEEVFKAPPTKPAAKSSSARRSPAAKASATAGSPA